jgi:hypothetical protein
MNGIWRNAVVALVLTALWATAGAEEIELPTWTVGDRWTFEKTEGPLSDNQGVFHSTVRTSVIEIRPKVYRTEITTQPAPGSDQKSTAERNISRGLNLYYRQNAQLPFTELQFLQWPLAVGKTWQFEHPMTDGGTFVWNVKVDRWEDVTVPAGSFKTLVISVEGKQTNGVQAQRRTVWYAPSAKWRVKEEWTGTSGRWIVARERWELQSHELH